MQPILVAKDVTKKFSAPYPASILNGVNLAVYPGQSIAISGRSGEGKSTLLHILGTLDTPTTGDVWIDQKRVNFWNRASLRRNSLGFVFQSYHLLEEQSVLDNVLLPAKLQGRLNQSLEKRAMTLLEQLGLSKRTRYEAHLLSGGEKQRVALARAFLLEPKLLLADEPTGNLDAESAAIIHSKLVGYAEQSDKAVIIVTHNNALATQCKKRYTLSNGNFEE